jgi:hypothetical protein
MRADDETLWYLGVGPLAAIALGVALVPLRELTTASNLTFAFLIWTIVVGELGGRSAALATAFTGALSLNFFLTRPYLSLVIHGRGDVIAFLGLAACGLLAASLGSRRGERLAARRELEQLHAAVGQLEYAGPLESRLSHVLAAVVSAFPVSAAVVRDSQGRLLARSGGTDERHPSSVVQTDTLIPGGPVRVWPGRSVPLPADGVRVSLIAGNAQVGWLDLWGNGQAASPETRRALSTVGRVVAALVALPRNSTRE